MPANFEFLIPINQFCKLEFTFNPLEHLHVEPADEDGKRARYLVKPELRINGRIPFVNIIFEKGHPYPENPGAPQRESSPISIEQNQTSTTQIIYIDGGFNKEFASGSQGWYVSNGILLLDEKNKKKIGFNSQYHQDNYKMMTCEITFY